MAATLMQTLDATIANVALPHMQGALGATPDQVSWVLTSYTIAAAIAMTPTGWLDDRIGMKRLFLFSVAGFAVASVLCGTSTTVPVLVEFRLLKARSVAVIGRASCREKGLQTYEYVWA